jgi:hypothetical protein
MNLCAPLDVLKSRHNDICDMLQLPLSSMPSASDVRLTGVAYIKALAEVYSANLQSDKSNRQCIRDMNASAQRLFQRLVVLRRQQLQYIGDSRYDVFLAHAGEDMFLYVDGQLNDKLKTSLNVFVDREAIQCADLTNDNGVDRGLLTSNVVLFVMSEHFICKPWPLYEFFFASARMDNEFESSGSGKIMVDSFHDPREISSNDWLSKLEQLALPWPAVLGGNMPPAVLSTHSRIVDHADRVIAELHKLLAAPSLASTHASSSAGTTTSARLICVFVLSGAIDIKDFCAELAPSCDPLSPALAVRSLHMHALTNRDDVSAPVLVALQLPSNAAIGRATRQDLAALIEVLQQPPLQTLWAAFFDTSTDEQGVLVSRASFVDDKFMPTTMPSPTLCEVDDTIHICALHVRANVACVAIAYVPQNNRDTLLLTISQQWVQHAAKVQHAAAEGGARRICHKFAFVQLHNVGGDVHTDRAAFWKEFGASFCAVVRSRSTEHFLVLPAHVGALMACLVRGGAWDAYLEWLAAQSSQVSVLGLPVRQVDAEAVRSLRMLRTDSIESFGYPAAFAAAVGEASWSERTNWIGSTDAVTFSLAQLDDDESALDVSRRASVERSSCTSARLSWAAVAVRARERSRRDVQSGGVLRERHGRDEERLRKRSSCTSARLSWATLARCSIWRCATRTARA